MEERFLELFNLYKNDIYRFIYSYTKNLYDADDILQSVFIKLYKHQNLFNKSNDEIKKWLIKVSINECKKSGCRGKPAASGQCKQRTRNKAGAEGCTAKGETWP